MSFLFTELTVLCTLLSHCMFYRNAGLGLCVKCRTFPLLMSALVWEVNGAAGTFFFQACPRGVGGAQRRSEKFPLPSASWAALFTEWRKESCAPYKYKCPLTRARSKRLSLNIKLKV